MYLHFRHLHSTRFVQTALCIFITWILCLWNSREEHTWNLMFLMTVTAQAWARLVPSPVTSSGHCQMLQRSQGILFIAEVALGENPLTWVLFAVDSWYSTPYSLRGCLFSRTLAGVPCKQILLLKLWMFLLFLWMPRCAETFQCKDPVCQLSSAKLQGWTTNMYWICCDFLTVLP